MNVIYICKQLAPLITNTKPVECVLRPWPKWKATSENFHQQILSRTLARPPRLKFKLYSVHCCCVFQIQIVQRTLSIVPFCEDMFGHLSEELKNANLKCYSARHLTVKRTFRKTLLHDLRDGTIVRDNFNLFWASCTCNCGHHYLMIQSKGFSHN